MRDEQEGVPRAPDGGLRSLLNLGVVVAVPVGLLVIAVATLPKSPQRVRFERSATARAIAAAPVPARARVLSIKSDATTGMACGWIDIGGRQGVVPFMVLQDAPTAPGRATVAFVPHLDAPSREVRVIEAFQKQMNVRWCEDRGLLTPTPPSAVVTPEIDRAMDDVLNSTARRWVLMPAPDGPGRMGVASAKGFPHETTPVFQSDAEVTAWIAANDGNAVTDPTPPGTAPRRSPMGPPPGSGGRRGR